MITQFNPKITQFKKKSGNWKIWSWVGCMYPPSGSNSIFDFLGS